MKKEILIIKEKRSGFVMNSIEISLKNEEFDVAIVPPDVTDIHAIKDNSPQLILLCLTNINLNDKGLFFYLKDMCDEKGKKIILIGDDKDETQKIANILTANSIHSTYTRPINVQALIEKIIGEMNQYAKDAEKKHILVVDDSGEMLRAVRSWLSGKYRVSMANSSANAIAFLATNKPDLILLDYEMPICTGPQMMEMIRAEISTESIPIIFLTGKSDMESVQKVLDLKPEGYLLKSMKSEEIIQKIDSFFNRF